MSRYLYSVVRCVPDPRTGEFVNVGAIAGDPTTGDWLIRQVSNSSRVRKLADPSILAAVHGWIAWVGKQLDDQLILLDEGTGEPLGEDWLESLFQEHRNVVQLSKPAPIVADTSEEALSTVFDQMVIDPSPRGYKFVTKHRVLSELRKAYRHALIEDKYVRSRVEIYVGDRVHSPVDFAVANGTVVQLTQAWSFQKATVADVSTQVKAWGYALQRVRDGDEARVLDGNHEPAAVESDVPIEVVVVGPKTPEQENIYGEALQVFADLDASVRQLEEAHEVGERAAALLGHGQSPL